MSRDLMVYVVDNKTNSVLNLYNDKQKVVTDFLFDNGPMRLLIEDRDDEAFVYNRGLPENCPENIKEDWEEYDSVCSWYDYCELAALSRTPEANLKNWDAMEESNWEPGMPYITYNPMPDFMKSVDLILAAYGKYYTKPGEITIICCLSF